jgi:hypothetical protein
LACCGAGETALFLARQFGVLDLRFDPIQVADAIEYLIRQLRLIVLGLHKLAPLMHPAIGMGNLLVPCRIAAVRHIAIADQGACEQVFQYALNMGSAPTR